MFQSFGPGELVTIGLVALIVFGPQRLPEIARKLGGYARELRKAATEIRVGLDEEVRQLREPLEAVKADLTKPVTEVKQSLSETADIVKKEIEPSADTPGRDLAQGRRSGAVQWVGPEPKTGASPREAWDGLDDPVPDEIRGSPPEVLAEADEGEPDEGESDGSGPALQDGS